MCRHRTAASWIAASYRPDLPVPVARSGVKHIWLTYTGSFNGLIRDAGWQAALQDLSEADIPVTLVAGAADGVPVSGRARQLARTWRNVGVLTHPTAGHGLPLTDPAWCRQLVTNAAARIID